MLTISLLCQVAVERKHISSRQEAALWAASWPGMYFSLLFPNFYGSSFDDLLWLNYAERSGQIIVRPGGKK
jgi:hypothetical protein